ncbi:transaldolase [Helicobacter mesocricetorum]|uniref:transaldolase n=1 Tax=Helicobacter mesocricetorum TaxID=87012 RepID=UPI000CF06E08|nr:transaldolase [Helicobacter mesocricetorum]
MSENVSFSLWCDFIEREFLENQFKAMVEGRVIQGATSNPAIFQQALTNASYQEQKESLKGKDLKEIYENLAIEDIKRAAEILLPIYEDNPNDGYISFEIDPNLCDNSKGSIEEGIRLFKSIGYPNVMIKIPATKAGIVAMEELILQGIPVNATLVFSKEQAIDCMESFKKAYDMLKERNKIELKEYPRAVISIFVSRFDRKCDEIFRDKEIPMATLGIKNAQYLYKIVKEYSLPVRPLFASTGVKGGDLEPSYYIKELYHPYAINTAPLAALESFIELKVVDDAYLPSNEELEDYFKMVKEAEIDIEAVAKELLQQGLEDFKEAFRKILESLN